MLLAFNCSFKEQPLLLAQSYASLIQKSLKKKLLRDYYYRHLLLSSSHRLKELYPKTVHQNQLLSV